jgi:Flp pilus assembly protein TadG
MQQRPGLRTALKHLRRDERGAFLIMVTVYLPVIVGFFTLAVDMSYVLQSRNMLQVAAESAALAASSQLPDQSAAVSFAKTYAAKNMPTVNYGNVVVDSDVVVGFWSQTCAGGTNCFVSAASSACGTGCNAVQVTARQAPSNNNALQLIFAPLIGMAAYNVAATATAVYGTGTGATWNVNVVEDISQSFSQQLASARAADQALLTCVHTNAGSGSKFGISLFTGVSPNPSYQIPISATDATNYTNLQNKITGINQCGSSGMPVCSGSNIAAGMTQTIATLCPGSSCSSSSSTRQAMIIVTDGIPNCGSTPNCSNSGLQAAAITAANLALTDKKKSTSIRSITAPAAVTRRGSPHWYAATASRSRRRIPPN